MDLLDQTEEKRETARHNLYLHSGVFTICTVLPKLHVWSSSCSRRRKLSLIELLCSKFAAGDRGGQSKSRNNALNFSSSVNVRPLRQVRESFEARHRATINVEFVEFEAAYRNRPKLTCLARLYFRRQRTTAATTKFTTNWVQNVDTLSLLLRCVPNHQATPCAEWDQGFHCESHRSSSTLPHRAQLQTHQSAEAHKRRNVVVRNWPSTRKQVRAS
jgi:hypothetical protein